MFPEFHLPKNNIFEEHYRGGPSFFFPFASNFIDFQLYLSSNSLCVAALIGSYPGQSSCQGIYWCNPSVLFFLLVAHLQSSVH